jgi:two-component system, LytTR family, sensor kinase
MPFDSRAQRQLLIHTLIWLGFIVYEQAIFLLSGTPPPSLASMLVNYLFNIGLFYLNSLVLLPRLYERRHYILYLSGVLSVLGTYALLRTALYLYVVPTLALGVAAVTGMVPASIKPFTFFLAQSFYRGVFFALLSAGYWFANWAVQLEVQKRQQQEELRIVERSLLEANLAFLKNQINPHFLFNSLNFLYAQVYPHSEAAARSIVLLAETMRYALHEETNGKVMLAEEVRHLHNYIALTQLRFNNQLQIDFQQCPAIDYLRIAPLVLITFVENCFKHGELTDAANPLRIRLDLEQNRLTFETHNRKRLGPKERSTGIGLANTRQRLDLLYPDRYTLALDNAAYHYTCRLIIYL